MSARFLRSLLVLGGAYWVAEWLASVIMAGVAALGIGYSGDGRLGELWVNVRLAAPRALAAAGGTALLWLTLGSAASRRWAWGLAGLFAVSGLVNRQFHPPPAWSPIQSVVQWTLPFIACCRRSGAWLPCGSSGVSRQPLVTARRLRSRLMFRRVASREGY